MIQKETQERMVIKMEGIYVCRMKYPMFLLILKLSESLGYEPVRRKDGVIVGGKEQGHSENTSVEEKRERKGGKRWHNLRVPKSAL